MAALIQAEQALGENLVWLNDKLDLAIRQHDRDTLRRLEQLNAAWKAACIAINAANTLR
jgi:hypothetical protein